MSFTTEIKQEIAFNILEECCARSELCAIIQLTSSLSIVNRQLQLIVRSESPTTAKRVKVLIKQLYNIETKLEIAQKTSLKKNNVYTINIIGDAKKILEDLGLYSEKGLLNHPSYKIVTKECCGRAYIAGCFLTYGSCNDPANTNYHLEISLADEDHARFVLKILNRYIEDGKITKRRNRYVLYIKKADSISDFLRLIGASDSLLKFENVRIARDYTHSIVRIENCYIANDVKTLDACHRQLDAINKIILNNKYELLDEKIKNVAELRLHNQEVNLQELCNLYFKNYGEVISKSGIKHRLDKIEEIANKL